MTLPFIDTSSPSGPSKPAGLNLRALLEEMVSRNASDLHIVAGERPKLRVDGDITNSSADSELNPKDTLQLAYSVLTEQQKKRFELEDELDFSFGIQNLARFRGNVFKQRGCVSMVVRQIPFAIKTFDELGLPGSIAKMAEKPRGLVLMTGPTGSGKSTTLAAMIDKINKELKGHIITVEDPIEFIHRHQSCIVNQREIGTDTNSFSAALKYALRQDPDVVLIGEMRDLEVRAAAGSRRRADRRNAGPRDHRRGLDDRRDGPPRLRDAPHQLGDGEHQPHHRRVPVPPAIADPRPARVRPRGGDHPDPAAEGEGAGPGHGGGDHDLHAGDPRADPRQQGAPDRIVDAGRQEVRDADVERRAVPALRGAGSDEGGVPARLGESERVPADDWRAAARGQGVDGARRGAAGSGQGGGAPLGAPPRE